MLELPTARPKLADFALLCAAAALAACQQPESPADYRNAAEEPVLNLPSVPTPEPALDRAALLAFVAEAASASASGAGVPAALRDLDGRQFELRIRFGCRGPSTDLGEQWLGWSYAADRRTLRLRARPTISMEEPLAAAIAGDQFESVEGFWIPRPWLLQPICPAMAAVRPPRDPVPSDDDDRTEGEAAAAAADDRVGEPVPASPRVGIVQFFTSQDARTGRRNMRPYEAVETLDEGTPIPSQGFDLVLSGRLRALPGRGVIECDARGPDSAPDCLVSARVQRVRIEQPASGDIIAEWGGG